MLEVVEAARAAISAVSAISVASPAEATAHEAAQQPEHAQPEERAPSSHPNHLPFPVRRARRPGAWQLSHHAYERWRRRVAADAHAILRLASADVAARQAALFEILLVVFFGTIERARRLDHRHDWPAMAA